VWNLEQKRLLIDSIFREMDIPKFYLWKIDQETLSGGYPDGEMKKHYKDILEKKRREDDEPNPFVYEVVDGQQRIRTILEYMGVGAKSSEYYRGVWGKQFPAPDDTPLAKGKCFAQLTANQQIKFKGGRLTVMVLEKAGIDDIRDMFTRLQNGTPLNAQEKRDAMGSSVGRIARDMALLPFFSKSVSFGAERSTHKLVASQMLQLERKEKIVSCTSRQLDKLYEFYRKAQFEKSVGDRTRTILTVLGKIFPNKNPHLNQNYALSLYWALSRITQSYKIPENEYARIKDNFERLDINRLEAMGRDFKEAPQDKIYEELTLAMSRGNTGTDGISTRHDILCQYLFQDVGLESLPKLDPQRIFTHEEKLILYHRANGCCQLSFAGKVCARQLDFDESAVDHISPHSKGGQTTLENGRIAHKSCNIARGTRDDFDPAIECSLLAGKSASES